MKHTTDDKHNNEGWVFISFVIDVGALDASTKDIQLHIVRTTIEVN